MRNPGYTHPDTLVIAAGLLCIIDGLMTLPYWHLEGNPVVLALGPVGMLTVKVSAVSALLWVWFRMDGVDNSIVARTCVLALFGLYAVVVQSNMFVLLSSSS